MKSEKGNPLGKYATPEIFSTNKIRDRPVLSFSTPLEVYNGCSEKHQKCINAVKNIFNSAPSVFIWHNGLVDDMCQFHGLHIHGGLYAPAETPVTQLQFFRKAKLTLKEQGISLRSEAIRNEIAILIHLQNSPRIVMGCNKQTLCGKLVQTMGLKNTMTEFTMNEEPQPSTSTVQNDFMSNLLQYNHTDDQNNLNNIQDMITRLSDDKVSFKDVLKDKMDCTVDKKVPTTKTANKLDIVMKYMSKYGTTNMDSIVKAIIHLGYHEELNEIRSLMLVNKNISLP